MKTLPWLPLLLLGSMLARAQSYPLPDVSGPHAVVMEMDPSLPDHTIYRPVNLASVRGRLPVLAFGNGGCGNAGNAFARLLGEIASHGYVVAASGPISEAVMAGQRPAAGGAQSRNEQLRETLDWAERVNAATNGRYRNRLDVKHLAVGGQSCGGLQALAVGSDPRVRTVVVLNSGIIRGGIPNPDGTVRQPSGYLPASDQDLARLHSPVLYLIGGQKDQAWRGAEGDYALLERLPVFNGNLDVGHGGTWQEPRGGEMGRVVIAWLDWQLKGRRQAARWFTGSDCTLCTDSRWTVKSRNLK